MASELNYASLVLIVSILFVVVVNYQRTSDKIFVNEAPVTPVTPPVVKIRGFQNLRETTRLDGRNNIAIGKAVTQSTTDESGDAEHALSKDDALLTKTESQCEPWWYLDLGEVCNIDNVVIRNGNGWMLKNFHVELLDRNESNELVTIEDIFHIGHASPVTLITFLSESKGQIVRVRFHEAECGILSLQEVTVYLQNILVKAD